MAITRFKARVGPSRISSGTAPHVTNNVATVNQQMKSVIKNMEAFIAHIEGVTPEILEHALIPAFVLSQKYVPERTGKLKKSGYLRKRTFRGNPQVEIGYGLGGRPHYAALVHERLDFYHKPPTRAKFLEAALNETEAQRRQTIIQLTKRASGL